MLKSVSGVRENLILSGSRRWGNGLRLLVAVIR